MEETYKSQFLAQLRPQYYSLAYDYSRLIKLDLSLFNYVLT